MDSLANLLEQLLRTPAESTQHCRNVAIRLIRRIRTGTKGEFELKYLLEDLLESLPTIEFGHVQLLRDIRKHASVFLAMKLPLRRSVSGTKRAGPPEPALEQASAKRVKNSLENAQLLYDYLHPLSRKSHSSAKSLLQVHANDIAPGTTLPDTPSLADLWNRIDIFAPARGAIIARRAEVQKMCQAATYATSETLAALEAVADLLAQLCAPVRDEQVKLLKNSLSSVREFVSLRSNASRVEQSLSASLGLAYRLVEDMNYDLKVFKLGAAAISESEDSLQFALRKEAMKREREAVTEATDNRPGEQTIEWIRITMGNQEAGLNRKSVSSALIKGLFKPEPVSVPGSAEIVCRNPLPPIFYLAARRLFQFQNRIQALVLLAVLSTLVPLSATSPTGWSTRIWTLLNSETESSETEPDHIKLINISDEMLAVLRHAAKTPLNKAEEAKVRENVSRMLRLEDPVYRLLAGRLERSLSETLVDKRPLLSIKGFAVVPLPEEVEEFADALGKTVEWAAECWDIQ